MASPIAVSRALLLPAIIASTCHALSLGTPSAPATQAAHGLSSGVMRLRGGAIFDKRTKPVWPVWPKGEIPEDGSVGAHYTMDEIIEGSQYVGESSPYMMFIGVTGYLLGACAFMYWFNAQPWVPELM